MMFSCTNCVEISACSFQEKLAIFAPNPCGKTCKYLLSLDDYNKAILRCREKVAKGN
jgi:hypothetical protein